MTWKNENTHLKISRISGRRTVCTNKIFSEALIDSDEREKLTTDCVWLTVYLLPRLCSDYWIYVSNLIGHSGVSRKGTVLVVEHAEEARVTLAIEVGKQAASQGQTGVVFLLQTNFVVRAVFTADQLVIQSSYWTLLHHVEAVGHEVLLYVVIVFGTKLNLRSFAFVEVNFVVAQSHHVYVRTRLFLTPTSKKSC